MVNLPYLCKNLHKITWKIVNILNPCFLIITKIYLKHLCCFVRFSGYLCIKIFFKAESMDCINQCTIKCSGRPVASTLYRKLTVVPSSWNPQEINARLYLCSIWVTRIFNPFPTDGTLMYRCKTILLITFYIDLYEILVKSFFYNF